MVEIGSNGAHPSNIIHQAAGMVSVQLDIDIEQAYERLDEYARHRQLAVGDVARDVVTRRLRLTMK